MRKGQGAMEYLMTYGWALLVVIIVGLVLWRSGIFGGAGTATATGFDKIRPLDWSYSGSTFSVVWANYAGQALRNVNFTFNDGTTTNTTSLTGALAPNGQASTSVGLSTCTSGSSYTVTVTVSYTTEAGLTHTEYGRITGTCA